MADLTHAYLPEAFFRQVMAAKIKSDVFHDVLPILAALNEALVKSLAEKANGEAVLFASELPDEYIAKEVGLSHWPTDPVEAGKERDYFLNKASQRFFQNLVVAAALEQMPETFDRIKNAVIARLMPHSRIGLAADKL